MPAHPSNEPLVSTNQPLNSGQSWVSPWEQRIGFSQVACRWVSTGGATVTVTVEEALDPANAVADVSQSAGTAGASGPTVPTIVNVAGPLVRMRVAVSVASATTLKATMSAMN